MSLLMQVYAFLLVEDQRDLSRGKTIQKIQLSVQNPKMKVKSKYTTIIAFYQFSITKMIEEMLFIVEMV